MHILKFMLVLVIFLQAGQAFSAPNPNTTSTSKTPVELAQTVDKVIKPFMQKFNIPALAVAVYMGNNERIFLYGVSNVEEHSPLTPNTLFEIGSVTKVFTSTALALHALRKDILLNEPIQKFFPAAIKNSSAFNDISLLFLATHTSGLPKNLVGDRSKMVPFLRNWSPSGDVGLHYGYSNLGYGLLGYALEKIEKRPYKEVIKEDITDPLQMKMTFVEVPSDIMLAHAAIGYRADGSVAPKRASDYLPGSGSIRSTIVDMLQFLKANMGVVGPEELVKAMKIAQEPFYQVREGFAIGLGWQTIGKEGETVIDKNGGVAGFSSYIGMNPGKKIGIVILTNKAKVNVAEVGRYLLKAL